MSVWGTRYSTPCQYKERDTIRLVSTGGLTVPYAWAVLALHTRGVGGRRQIYIGAHHVVVGLAKLSIGPTPSPGTTIRPHQYRRISTENYPVLPHASTGSGIKYA
eukprot:3941742-Rhodomonas_salina.1